VLCSIPKILAVLAVLLNGISHSGCPADVHYLDSHGFDSHQHDSHQHDSHQHLDNDGHHAHHTDHSTHTHTSTNDPHHTACQLSDPFHEHDSNTPAHIHCCQADPTAHQQRISIQVPQLVVVSIIAAPEHDFGMPHRAVVLKSVGRWCTGPPPAVKTTRLLI